MISNSKQSKPSLLLATQENNFRTIEENRKLDITKNCETKPYVSNKVSKTILKPSTTKKMVTNVSSTAPEIKKCDLSQTQSHILMTTIDSDGIKSVTSAAGTRHIKFLSFFRNYLQ